MADYDIRKAFEEIELELIRSMQRNLKRHLDEEADLGINWSMWQAEQLKAMKKYRDRNQKIFGKKFRGINKEVKKMLREHAKLEGFKQERSILSYLSGGKLKKRQGSGMEGSFIGMSENRMDALINATVNDLSQAEYAMLRMADDQYRKTIFTAQTYMNSGAATMKQAVDMATHDFLRAGINCIEYKDGRRVNIASYAEMYLRTSTTRATLISDGGMRQQYGIHTVKVSTYGECSPTCMPWQGKVYVDDVYSGGTAKEAEESGYPLLSTAIAGGLFHPNCKHISSTYIPGLENPDSGEGLRDEINEKYRSKIKDLDNKIQREKRFVAGSVDEEKQKVHQGRLRLYDAMRYNFLHGGGGVPHSAQTDKQDLWLDPETKIPLPDKFTYVTSRYRESLVPGQGDYTIHPNFKLSKFTRHDLYFSQWLHDMIGGDVILNEKVDVTGVKSPDFIWRGKLWDGKKPESEKGIDGLIRDGIIQIEQRPGAEGAKPWFPGILPGGVAIDLPDDAPLDEVIRKVTYRVDRSSRGPMDVLLKSGDKRYVVLHYEK